MSAVRDALAARLNVILPVLGCGYVKATPNDLHRVYAGRSQRSCGSFSWFLNSTVEVGSQHSMADCVRFPVIVSVSVTSWVLNPLKRGDASLGEVPAGGMFATMCSWNGKIEQWYDAAGKEIAVR